ncbi:hypothetical protein ACAG96_04455 [Candidatus Izemoplasma sp. B36]|uniref:hypothetical protein n=1 Tax=Candidatus Izemoplasma sp. B36 TaxID=3242468 RepID=UPI003557B1A1
MKKIYSEIKEKLNMISFQNIFNGFKRYPFALYDDKQVLLEDKIIPYDDRFIGNTSIKYNNKYIAIWNMKYPVKDLDQFTSKIVHEMFHAYQGDKHEHRFPNEVSGLFYNLSKDNIGKKLEETKYLINSYLTKDKLDLEKFLTLRGKRRKLYSKSVNYEAGIETIEGYARFIELKTLKFFSLEKYNDEFNKLLDYLKTDYNFYKPRNVSYEIGALILTVLESLGYDISSNFPRNETIDLYVLPNSEVSVEYKNNYNLSWLDDLLSKSNERLDNLLVKNLEEIAFDRVIGFDPMNTKKVKDHLIYNHFILIEKNNKNISMMGCFLMKLNEKNEFTKLYKVVE